MCLLAGAKLYVRAVAKGRFGVYCSNLPTRTAPGRRAVQATPNWINQMNSAFRRYQVFLDFFRHPHDFVDCLA